MTKAETRLVKAKVNLTRDPNASIVEAVQKATEARDKISGVRAKAMVASLDMLGAGVGSGKVHVVLLPSQASSST
jgi:hypothetical protein